MLKHLRQLASESIVYGLSGVLMGFVSVLLVPFTTRMFTPEQYGVVGLVSITMAFVSTMVVLGLDNSAGRWFWDTEELADRKQTIASSGWCQLAISVVAGVLVLLFAPWLGRVITGRADAGICFTLVAFSLPLRTLDGTLSRWLRFQRRAWATVACGVGGSLVILSLTILFVVVYRWGLPGYFLAQLAAYSVTGTLCLALMRDWLNPRHFRWARLREMLGYALPLVPGGVALWALNLADRYFVRYYASTGQVGLYQLGSSIASYGAICTSGFIQAWGPFAFSIHTSPEARAVYARALLVYTWLSCLMAAAVTSLAPEVLRLLTRPAYYGASTVVGLLSLCWVLEGLYYIGALGPGLARNTKSVGVAVTIAAALNIVLNFLLIPRWGKEGAAAATFLALAVRAVYMFYSSHKLYPIPYRFAPVVGLMLLAAGLMGINSAWQIGPLWGAAAVKLAWLTLFIPALFMTRIITPSQLEQGFLLLRDRGYFRAAVRTSD